MPSKQDLVYIAQVNENAERYQDMKETLLKIVDLGEELSDKERNLLSVAYKNLVGPARSAWRVVSNIEKNEQNKGESERLKFVISYRKTIEKELKDLCLEVLDLVEKKFIPTASTASAKVFYYKMKADYYRYLAEFQTGEERANSAKQALEAYKQAQDVAEELSPQDTNRLGLALNFSVFYYEIMKNSKEACALARNAFEAAVNGLEQLSQEAYKDATLIMQLLRDNLNLWTNEEDVEQE